MNQSIIDLISMGQLPLESSSDIHLIQKYQDLLHKIAPPISNKEATALVSLFGDDDCYGLAWRLLHLIESCESLSIDDDVIRKGNPWVKQLIKRSKNKDKIKKSQDKNVQL